MPRVQTAFVLLELLVAIFVFGLLAVGVSSLSSLGTKTALISEQRTVAQALAKEEAEKVRILTYTDVGYTDSNGTEPDGTLQRTKTLYRNGQGFLVTTSISLEDDPTNGPISGTKRESNADYKQVLLTVQLPNTASQFNVQQGVLVAPTVGTGQASIVAPVAGGGFHSCGLDSGRGARCWGTAAYGQLGIGGAYPGTTTVTHASSRVIGLDSGVTGIFAGDEHTCAIHNGAAKCWGRNDRGQLGNGTSTNATSPTQVSALQSGVTALATGLHHSCSVHNGAAKCWGSCQYNQTGHGEGAIGGSAGGGCSGGNIGVIGVAGLSTGVTAITAGNLHSCAIHNGAAKCWGHNTSGQLGNGEVISTNAPVQVTGLESGVTAIAAGKDFTCAIHNGAAKCWGISTRGQLGNGTNTYSTTATQVVGLTSDVTGLAVTAVGISEGADSACAIHAGAAKCWGDDSYQQLGNGGAGVMSTTPVDVTGLSSSVTSITGGFQHHCAVHNTIVKCWGRNDTYQLGNGAWSTLAATPENVLSSQQPITPLVAAQ